MKYLKFIRWLKRADSMPDQVFSLSSRQNHKHRPRWQKRHRVNQRVGGGVRFFDSIVCNKINCFYSSISIRRLLSDERSEALPIDWWANFHARLRIICNQIHAADDEWNYVKGKRPRTYKSRFAVSSPAVIFLCNVAVARFWFGLMMHARFGAVEPDRDEIRYCHDTRLSHKLSTSRINFIIFCHQLGEKRMNNYPGRVNIFSFFNSLCLAFDAWPLPNKFNGFVDKISHMKMISGVVWDDVEFQFN